MIFKRPSFKRGGTPTGIETLTPRTKAADGFPGMQYYGEKGPRIRTFLPQSTPLGTFLRGASAYGAPIAAQAGIAYLNRPRTKESLQYMKEMDRAGVFDETAGDDYLSFAEQSIIKDQQGEPISFTDAFFLDPKTDTYPRILGRVEDRNKRIELEKKKKEAEEKKEADLSGIGEGKSAEVLPGESALDAVLREGKILSEKNAKEQEVPNSKDTDPGGETVEKSFESEYDRQMERLEKYFGKDDDTKARLALGLSEAIGTPGSVADKAAALNKVLLGIKASQKKDKREMAKLAYATATELEKTKIAAGKQGFQERLFNEYVRLDSKKDKTPTEEKRLSQLKGGLNIKSGLTGTTATAAGTIANEIRGAIISLNEAAEEEKGQITAEIIGGINQLLLLQGIDKSNIGNIIGYDVSQFLADGGRVGKAIGGPAETPTQPVETKLTFEQLRTRLPKEITDDIVRLVATSEEALQDFSYIRTQGDVEKFNVKYGVNLVLPQDTA